MFLKFCEISRKKKRNFRLAALTCGDLGGDDAQLSLLSASFIVKIENRFR